MADRGGKKGRPSKMQKSLSLDRFANAKKSTYDPRQVKKKQRERAVITIAKYKKLKKRLGLQPRERPAAGSDREQDEQDEELEDHQYAADAAEAAEKKKSEKELELEQQREAAAAAKAQREAAAQRRKAEHKLFKKKTQRGQPVMKHRIEKMLEQLEKK